jgi:hypothetical protein
MSKGVTEQLEETRETRIHAGIPEDAMGSAMTKRNFSVLLCLLLSWNLTALGQERSIDPTATTLSSADRSQEKSATETVILTDPLWTPREGVGQDPNGTGAEENNQGTLYLSSDFGFIHAIIAPPLRKTTWNKNSDMETSMTAAERKDFEIWHEQFCEDVFKIWRTKTNRQQQLPLELFGDHTSLIIGVPAGRNEAEFGKLVRTVPTSPPASLKTKFFYFDLIGGIDSHQFPIKHIRELGVLITRDRNKITVVNSKWRISALGKVKPTVWNVSSTEFAQIVDQYERGTPMQALGTVQPTRVELSVHALLRHCKPSDGMKRH